MAYTPYIPQFYPPQGTGAMQYYPTQQNNQSSNSIIWVQGEQAAKAYPVSAGQSMLLMDSENPLMYIKSTDQSGMPLPLRIFEIHEKIQNGNQQPTQTPNVDYVPRSEFDKLRDKVEELMRQPKNNGYKKPVKEEG